MEACRMPSSGEDLETKSAGEGRVPARARRATGAPSLWGRARRVIWKWWLWGGAAAGALASGHRGYAIGFAATSVVVYLFTPSENSPTYGLVHDFPIDSTEFVSTISGATDSPFFAGNRIDILNNGVEFYPAMLEAITGARRSVTVEAYIYWGGDTGMRFARALADRARAGVQVKILLDAVGSASIGGEILDVMTSAGCEVEWYHPVFWYTVNRVNNRTHRKSVIVDGRIGFTGGAGIADHWLGDAEDPEHWRDIQIRIEGPAVTPLQTGFARNWLETTGELVSGEDYYPDAGRPGNLAAQSILSSPETGSSTVRIMYYLSIVCARESILIANPYFVPDYQAVRVLIEAKRRGVDVKIMVSGDHNDNTLARLNSRRLYGELLEAGVEIHEYNRTMLHHKCMVCDGLWTTVGTTNFDNRSFALNEENNVCVYDRAFAARMSEIFRKDIDACDRVELEAWRRRGALARIGEFVASALKEQV
jgi:cardiolipin synthase A/B